MRYVFLFLRTDKWSLTVFSFSCGNGPSTRHFGHFEGFRCPSDCLISFADAFSPVVKYTIRPFVELSPGTEVGTKCPDYKTRFRDSKRGGVLLEDSTGDARPLASGKSLCLSSVQDDPTRRPNGPVLVYGPRGSR